MDASRLLRFSDCYLIGVGNTVAKVEYYKQHQLWWCKKATTLVFFFCVLNYKVELVKLKFSSSWIQNIMSKVVPQGPEY